MIITLDMLYSYMHPHTVEALQIQTVSKRAMPFEGETTPRLDRKNTVLKDREFAYKGIKYTDTTASHSINNSLYLKSPYRISAHVS